MRDDDALDRRRFADLVEEATAIIRRNCPDWTDLGPGDPGMTLVEVYAWLTETMLYRLNRLPARLHAELLGLLGAAPLPPAAAQVMLAFSRPADMPLPALELAAGTQVADAGGAVVFATMAPLRLAEGQVAAEVAALHAEWVEAEPLGRGNGDGGQSLVLRRPPVLRPLPGIETLRIGVELAPDQQPGAAQTITVDGRVFVLWTEVAGFSARPGARVYVADRSSGRITFAPASGAAQGAAATLAGVPAEGAEIRAWYATGGGRAGNVAPQVLRQLRKPLPGIEVTNPRRATGGEDGESRAAFLARARGEIRSLDCAVTAADFERIALDAGGIARATAAAQRDRWVFGTPGLVEVLVIPAVEPDPATGAVTAAALAAHRTELLAQRVGAALDAHRPIGVRCDVRWGRCLPIGVAARVAVVPSEDCAQMAARITRRLNRLLSPAGGWQFGRGLRVSDIYETILDEPGVRYAERLSLQAGEGPEGPVAALLGDPNQPRCLYALMPDGPYRSLDNGASWECVLATGDLPPVALTADAGTPGFLALIGRGEGGGSQLWTSGDCGEGWAALERIEFAVNGLAITRHDNRHWILLASDKGLLRTGRDGERGVLPVPLAREAGAGAEGCYDVAADSNLSGMRFAAVALQKKAGIWLSSAAGAAESFRLLPGSQGRDIRRLRFQRSGGQLWLWAGLRAEDGQPGEGLMRIAIREDGLDPAGWQAVKAGWRGGSCLDFDLRGGGIAAGTRDGGVLVIDDIAADPVWRAPTLSSGLPIDDSRERLLPVGAVAFGQGGTQPLIAGGPRGLFAGEVTGLGFSPAGGRVFSDQVRLPPRWLFCAGEHRIEVFTDLQDRGRGDETG